MLHGGIIAGQWGLRIWAWACTHVAGTHGHERHVSMGVRFHGCMGLGSSGILIHMHGCKRARQHRSKLVIVHEDPLQSLWEKATPGGGDKRHSKQIYNYKMLVAKYHFVIRFVSKWSWLLMRHTMILNNTRSMLALVFWEVLTSHPHASPLLFLVQC